MLLASAMIAAISAVSCSNADQARGICVLMDTAGAGRIAHQHARLLVNHLLDKLQANDTLAVIDIGRNTADRNRMIADITFGARPLTVNRQKRAFADAVADAVAVENAGADPQTLSGSMIQAVDYLDRIESGRKFILVYSDLMDPRKDEVGANASLQLTGYRIIAVDVGDLRGEGFDLRAYLKRLALWQQRVESAGGHWHLINDHEELGRVFR